MTLIDPVRSIATNESLQFSRTSQTGSSSPVTFADTVNSLLSNSVQTIKASEEAAVNGLMGKAPVSDAIHAVMAAERSLHTVVALRDKAIAAYQEVSRMQI